jgi:hypothetical protein
MQLTSNGITVSIPDSEVIAMALARLNAGAAIAPKPGAAPAIGSVWAGQGGIYAGVVRGDEGQPDYHMIVANSEREGTNWKDALAWVKDLKASGGHTDFELPKRKEQAILFGNVPELFAKEWYWSSEQYAPYDGYAWCQFFHDGSQGSLHKSGSLRARAVRRLPIQ